MIIWTLFAIVMAFLIAKATIEAIWGICLLIYAVACYICAFALNLLAMMIRFCGRVSGKAPKKPRRAMTIGESMMVASRPNSREAKHILASLW